jgi:hypothetical protein
MRRVLMVICVWAVAAMPAPTHAWGFDAHKFIMERAIGLLPAEIRPFFELHKSTLVERAIDPDTWQVAGFNDQEDQHHFLDLDWEGYGKYPYAGLPRDYTAAVAKFGKKRVDDNGTVPWRVEEMYGNLRRAFESYERRGPFGRFDVIFFSAWLTHYVSDAHVPFHAVLNYDGQLSGQHGIHARFEAYLFERYRNRTLATTSSTSCWKARSSCLRSSSPISMRLAHATNTTMRITPPSSAPTGLSSSGDSMSRLPPQRR